MNYREFQPATRLHPYLECFWLAEGDGNGDEQKIVPDGFTEIVFHYGDHYQFRNYLHPLKIQSRGIVAGQITQPVFLTPIGTSGAIGIKFKPTGIWKLLGWKMAPLSDDAVDLTEFGGVPVGELTGQLRTAATCEDRIRIIENLLHQKLKGARESAVDQVIVEIDLSKGALPITTLQKRFSIPARKMERLFLDQVGISAKRYARIVRFRHVFRLLQKKSWSKAEVTYLAGYFDQPHFNKEFRSFSGEDPGSYFAHRHEFANFFLNRPVVFLQDKIARGNEI